MEGGNNFMTIANDFPLNALMAQYSTTNFFQDFTNLKFDYTWDFEQGRNKNANPTSISLLDGSSITSQAKLGSMRCTNLSVERQREHSSTDCQMDCTMQT